MMALVRAVRGALVGGRFLTVWSAVAVTLLSLTIMAPVGAGIDVVRAFPATVGATLALLVGLGLVAAGERRVRRASTRTVIVVGGVLVCAALRPIAQDLWAGALELPTPSASQLPFRIATNVVVWPIVLAAVAELTQSLRALRHTNALLREVVGELAGARERAGRAERAARGLLEAATAALQRDIDALADAPRGAEGAPGAEAGAEAVRRLAGDGFREWAHRLQELAEDAGAPPSLPVATVPARRGDVGGDAAGARLALRVPPRGAVTLLYVVCTLPFALRTTAPAALLVGLVVVCVVGAAVDAVPRMRRFGGSARSATTAFLVAALVAGATLSVVAAMTGQTGVPVILPTVDYVAVAGAASLCAGALHARRREQRRLSGAIARAQEAMRDGVRPVREGLRRTAELLHREGQGACVQFALAHPAPLGDDIARLRGALTDVVRRIPAAYASAEHGADADADADALDRLTDTWRRVIALDVDISPAARSALDRAPWVARDVYDVAAEGLLNAVKHGGRPRAAIEVALVATGAGPRMRVRVRSEGELAPGTGLRPASHLRHLGAQLSSAGTGTLLEASFALPSAATVVSAEHPARRAAPGT